MSKSSRFFNGKSITPGNQIVHVISTENPDGKAALVLKEIAKDYKGSRITRSFPKEWERRDNILINEGLVTFKDNNYPLILKIGACEGLSLKDIPGNNLSMKPVKDKMLLEIGDKVIHKRIDSYVDELIGCWVVHGSNWLNRKGELIRNPYGFQKKGMFEKLYFNIVDGAKEPKITLQELINLGCIRSTHVGEWNGRHSTLIAAMCDMPLILHEFKEGGSDICFFNGLKISNDQKVWGPYCAWDEYARRFNQLGIWQDLALKSVSPFAFHVHATRALFPKAKLDSDVILEGVGKEKLNCVLELIVTEDPERFYRLIDENGITHRLREIEKDYLSYGTYGRFSRRSIVNNVIKSLEHLQLVQTDCTYSMPRIPRIVPDTHFYLVLESILQKKKSVYALSGRDMHRYLTQDDSASMHCVRNERLFLLLRDIFGATSINFYVYPPLTVESGITSQYGDLRKFYKNYFLSQEV